jgi:hypothetical protein
MKDKEPLKTPQAVPVANLLGICQCFALPSSEKTPCNHREAEFKNTENDQWSKIECVEREAGYHLPP